MGSGFLLIDDPSSTHRQDGASLFRQFAAQGLLRHALREARRAGLSSTTCVKEFKQDKWIFFPWDIDYQFVKTIKDGGKGAPGPDALAHARLEKGGRICMPGHGHEAAVGDADLGDDRPTG